MDGIFGAQQKAEKIDSKGEHSTKLSEAQPVIIGLRAEKVVSWIIELIEVFIEQIWYYRGIYPKESFEKVRSFQLEVYRNVHPGVQKYLENVSNKLLDLLKRGKLSRIFVAIYNPGDNSSEPIDVAGIKEESYAISFTDSIIFDYFRQNCPVQFDSSFNEQHLYASMQSFLYSVICELVKMPKFTSFIPDFRLFVSADKESFGEFVKSPDWLLESTDQDEESRSANGEGLHSKRSKYSHVRVFKEVNLGYLSIKGYAAKDRSEDF